MFLRVTKLRDKCVRRRAEYRHEQIESYQQRKEDHIVDDDVACLRQRKESDSYERKWDSNSTHEWYAAAALIFCAIGPSCDQRVCNGIEHTSHGQHQSEERKLEYDRMLGDPRSKYSRERILRIRRTGIIINHPV